MSLIILAASVGLILVILYFQRKLQFSFSDHYFHIAMVRAIKANRHRFVKEHPNFLVEENFAYPQLYHWLLSFLPEKVYTERHYLVNVASSLLSFATVELLLWFLFKDMFANPALEVPLCGLLLSTTPIFYLPWNARNMGLSPRSMGVLLGQAFALLSLYNLLHFDWLVTGLVMLTGILSVLSSQFTTQFVVFSSLLMSALFLRVWPLATLFLSFFIPWVFMPSVMKKYFRGQLWHKYIFSKYLSREYVLAARYSIWGDFTGEIFRHFKRNRKSAIMYTYSNPLLLLVWAIPMFFPVLITGAMHLSLPLPNINTPAFPGSADAALWMLTRFNGLGLLLFVIFSFRKTRFLGEPERYVELFVPAILLEFFVLARRMETNITIAIALYSLLVLAALFVIQYRSGSKTVVQRQQAFDRLYETALPDMQGGSLLSNSWHVMRRFYGTDIKTFTPCFTGMRTGEISLTDIFKESFIYMDASCIGPITATYPIDYCIVDTEVVGGAGWQQQMENGAGKRLAKVDQFIVYKLKP